MLNKEMVFCIATWIMFYGCVISVHFQVEICTSLRSIGELSFEMKLNWVKLTMSYLNYIEWNGRLFVKKWAILTLEDGSRETEISSVVFFALEYKIGSVGTCLA